jgi:hypothetical protein
MVYFADTVHVLLITNSYTFLILYIHGTFSIVKNALLTDGKV